MAEAVQKAVECAYFSFREIDGLVVVSSSGIATPALDAPLMERLNRDEKPDVFDRALRRKATSP